jgi:GTP-binding protein
MAGIVAIVGRPNVGKSTLFNRLLGTRKSIVDNESGITRDRIYGTSDWNGKEFTVIDTGGFVEGSDDIFEKAIRDQVLIAMEEADVIVFLLDVSTGVTDLDSEVAKLLRKQKKPLVTVVNKVDNYYRDLDANEFYSLGLGDMFKVSAISGSGTGELLDRVVEHLPDEEEDNDDDKIPKFTIIGRPNVGKSSFLNVLLGEERNIVTDIAGTTRDTINSRYNYFGKDFILVDTAGIRKKSKVFENIEFYSVMRAVKAIEEADVCFLLIDAKDGFESQDVNIFKLAQKRKKGIVILVNKWDLVEKDHKTTESFITQIKEKIAPFTDVPIIFVSALTKQRIFKAVEKGLDVYNNKSKKISTSNLNKFLEDAIQHYPPPSFKGKHIKIKYATQIDGRYPAFAFFANLPQYVKEAYIRYLENKLRDTFDFEGVPLTLWFRKK